MKNKYIQALLSEIQQLESKVVNLKENQAVSFSFFKESFKRTQEITRLLHELEFVQIEDMKNQMGKLVQFLSEVESVKEDAPTQLPFETLEEPDNNSREVSEHNKRTQKEGLSPMPIPSTSKFIPEVEIKEDYPQLEGDVSRVKPNLIKKRDVENKDFVGEGFPHNNSHKDTPIDLLTTKNKSLNDIQPTNHTVLDTKRSISLNDKFLFQRELFNNNKQAMDIMLAKLQTFNNFAQLEEYLRSETTWDFKDGTVSKFIEMLKESF